MRTTVTTVMNMSTFASANEASYGLEQRGITVKILVLDIDGVANSAHSRFAAHQIKVGDWGTHRAWIPEAVEQLKRIIAETGCKLVISSDWRLPKNIAALKEGFEAFNLPAWIGTTPEFGLNNRTACIRGLEIEHWLKEAKERGETIEAFAILDDHNWMTVEQQRNFVQTDDNIGLLKIEADEVIRILNNVG